MNLWVLSRKASSETRIGFLLHMDNTYRDYLVSKKWASLKRAVHFFYEEECYICKSREKLYVHHKTYDRLYHEDLDDLVLVCFDCHSKIHDKSDTKENNYILLLEWKYKTPFEYKMEWFSDLFDNLNK